MRILLYLFVFGLFFTACKSDSSASSAEEAVVEELDIESINVDDVEEVDIEVKMDEAIPQEDLAKKILVESKNKKVDEIAKVEDKNETKLQGKSDEQKKKEAELKLEATKKMIDDSVNKGKSCDQIVKDQIAFIDEFEKSGDKKVILKIYKQKQDPFYAQCLESDDFKAKDEELTTRLETIMDKM